MAGGFGHNQNSKTQKSGKIFNNAEVLKDNSDSRADSKSIPKFSLRGVLGLNQTVELSRNTKSAENKSKEIFSSISYLEKEQKILFDQHQKELTRELENLRLEISKLAQATDNLEKSVETAIYSPIIEVSEYEIGFLNRIKSFIASFRKNIGEASLWVESFNSKKKKKNAFWSTVKNKKKGGEQYLFSNEHSAARSAG